MNRTQEDRFDAYWESQVHTIDNIWWPKINFMGYMGSLQEDTKTLLTSLTSNKDNMSAWEKVGKEGWVSSDGIKGGLMEANRAGHAQHEKIICYCIIHQTQINLCSRIGKMSGSMQVIILMSCISLRMKEEIPHDRRFDCLVQTR